MHFFHVSVAVQKKREPIIKRSGGPSTCKKMATILEEFTFFYATGHGGFLRSENKLQRGRGQNGLLKIDGFSERHFLCSSGVF